MSNAEMPKHIVLKRTPSAGGRCICRWQHGFTFIEIMIVLVIVAILTAIVLPNYQDGVRKSRRTDGRAALAEMAAKQEQFFAQNNTYTTTIDVAGTGLGMGSTTSKDGYYNLTAAAGDCGTISRCYLLTATATGAQADDTPCNKLTLDSLGRRAGYTSGGAANTDICW